MAATDSWYDIVAGTALAQGDILLECPLPRIETYTYPLPELLDVLVDIHHLVVLSQSCDLENDKVDEILLAAVLEYEQLAVLEGDANSFIRSAKWRKAAINGDLAPYSVLPEVDGPPLMRWSLVDFHHLFTLPKPYVIEFAGSVGRRLRLVPPYREHLAQAFARYVMRVGLPAPLHGFEKLQIKHG